MKYNWENNAKPWRTAMYDRMRNRVLVTGGTLFFVFALIPILLLSFTRWDNQPRQFITWFILIVLATLQCIHAFRQHRRDHLITQQIPLLHARMCPKCLTAQKKADPSPTENHPPSPQTCPHCSESCDPNQVEDYWAIYPHRKGPFRSWRTCLDSFSIHGKYQPDQPLSPLLRIRSRDGLMTILTVLAFYLSYTIILFPGSLLVNLISHNSFLFVFLLPLLLLLGLALKRRVGQSVHCLKCNYEKAPDISTRCSECGEDWSWPFQCVRGKNKPSWLLAGIAVTPFLLQVGGPFALRMAGSTLTIMQILPTSSLITQIAEDYGFVMDEWAEINQRTLTPHQTRTLFLGLLEKRHKYLSQDGYKWIIAQIKTITIPQNLIDRFYRESFRIESLSPLTAHPGETISLTLELYDEFIFAPQNTNHLLLESIEINGQPIPNSRPDQPFSPHRLPRPHTQTTKIRHYPCPIPLTLPDQPGPVQIKIIYWQIYAPRTPGLPTAQWNQDHTPILPPNHIWAKRIEKEFTLTIK